MTINPTQFDTVEFSKYANLLWNDFIKRDLTDEEYDYAKSLALVFHQQGYDLYKQPETEITPGKVYRSPSYFHWIMKQTYIQFVVKNKRAA